MADVAALPPLRGHELHLLSLQRRKAVRRVHERARNVALAVAGLAGLAVLLGLGANAGWGLAGSAPSAGPLDERTRAFATARIGRILLPLGDQMCRELEFYNDSGKFRGNRLVRCDMMAGILDPLGGPTSGRGASVRALFSKP